MNDVGIEPSVNPPDFCELPSDFSWGYGVDALATKSRLWIAFEAETVTPDSKVYILMYSHKENGFDIFKCVNQYCGGGIARIQSGRVEVKFTPSHFSDCMHLKRSFDLTSALIACCLHPPLERYHLTTFTNNDEVLSFNGLTSQGYEFLEDIETVGKSKAVALRCKACSSTWAKRNAVAWRGQLDNGELFLLEDLCGIHACDYVSPLKTVLLVNADQIKIEAELDLPNASETSCTIPTTVERELMSGKRRKRVNTPSVDTFEDESSSPSNQSDSLSDSHPSLSSLSSTVNLMTDESSFECESSRSSSHTSKSSSSSTSSVTCLSQFPSPKKSQPTTSNLTKASTFYFHILKTPIFVERPSLTWLRRSCLKLKLPQSYCEIAYSDYWAKLESSIVYLDSKPIEYFSISKDTEFFPFIFSGTTNPVKSLLKTACDLASDKLPFIEYDMFVYEKFISGQNHIGSYQSLKWKTALRGPRFTPAHLPVIAEAVNCRFLVSKNGSWHAWGDAKSNEVPTIMLKMDEDGNFAGVTKVL
uniref:AAA domain-containing protein n=1 Tax=Panagrellus redivivus TaxID=6233 RepID=A0A7E4VDL8_PANRE